MSTAVLELPAADPEDPREFGFARAEVERILAPFHARAERLVRRVLACHFLLALALGPFYDTWLVTLPAATAALLIFHVSVWLAPGTFVTRCVAGIALQMFVALHIYQMHGLPEMHFFFFTAVAVLIAQYDWKAMWPGTVLIVAQHIVFAVLNNDGARVYFFEEAYVGFTKWFFHFGIASAHVGICGYWAFTLRRDTLREARRKRDTARLAVVAQKTLNAVILSDASGRATWVNEGFTRLTGYTADEALGRDPQTLLRNPRSDPPTPTGRRPTPWWEGPADGEVCFRTKDGQARWLARTATPLRDADGRIQGYITIGGDITERKRVEAERARALEERERLLAQLKTERAWLETILEQVPAGLYVAEASGRVVLTNSRARQILGHSPPEAVAGQAEGWGEAFYPDGRPVPPERWTLRRALHGEVVRGEEYLYRRPDGTQVWVRTNGAPLRGPGGVAVGGIAAFDDIDEQRRGEAALREANDRVRDQAALLDKAHDAILVRDMAGRIVYWNRGAERLYGWTADEAVGRDCRTLLGRPGADDGSDDAPILSAAGEWQGEARHLTRAGRELIVLSSETLVRDEAGQPKSVLVINTDVTEKQKLEARLLRAQRLEGLGLLASGIAHDLNNILTPLALAVDVLPHVPDPLQRDQVLHSLRTGLERGAGLIRQILTFSRGGEGQRLRPLRPAQVLAEAEEILTHTLPKSVALETSVAPELWPVLGDPTGLCQVVMNLCVNARDAMPAGGRLSICASNVRLNEEAVRKNPDARPGRYVQLTVSDTGTGIAADVLDKIFDPFFTTKEVGKGTGLGLSSAMGIVKGHGGFMDVSSVVGRGSQFRVYLPAADGVAGPAAPAEATALTVGRKVLILLVDDEPIIRDVGRRTLETFGYRVVTACDGAEGVSRYVEYQKEIGLVLVDMMMPIMDGPTMIRAIRRLDPKVRVVAASGLSGPAADDPESRPDVFLPKPYTARQLLDTLHRVLDAADATPPTV